MDVPVSSSENVLVQERLAQLAIMDSLRPPPPAPGGGAGQGLDNHPTLVNTELTQSLGCCGELGTLEVKGYRAESMQSTHRHQTASPKCMFCCFTN